MNIEVEALSMKEMKELQGKLDRAISTYEDRKRREALDAIRATARQYGFSLEDIIGTKPRGAGTVRPKYANPNDSTMTWTGRGRKPRWVIAHLAEGRALEDMAI